MLAESDNAQVIVSMMKYYFSDYALFDEEVAERLHDAIATGAMEMENMSGRKVTQKYFDVEAYTTEEQKKALQQVDLIFETAHVLIRAMLPENAEHHWTDTATLLENYPQFRVLDTDKPGDLEQLHWLLRYRNAVKIALTIFPAWRNKARIMSIAAKLEGAQRDYITGKGQSIDVTRRVQIYQQEGDIEPEKRPARDRPLKIKRDDIDKPTISPYSVKKAKIVRLQPDKRRNEEDDLDLDVEVNFSLPGIVAPSVPLHPEKEAESEPNRGKQSPRAPVLIALDASVLTVPTSIAPYLTADASAPWRSSLLDMGSARGGESDHRWRETSLGFFLGSLADPTELKRVF